MYYQNIPCTILAERRDQSFIELDKAWTLLIVPTSDLSINKVRQYSEFACCKREIEDIEKSILTLKEELRTLNMKVKVARDNKP